MDSAPQQPPPRQDGPPRPENTGFMLSQILARVSEMKNLMQSEMLPKISRAAAVASQGSQSMIPWEVNPLTAVLIAMTIGMVVGLSMSTYSAVQYTQGGTDEKTAVSNSLIGLVVFMICAIISLLLAFYFFLTA